MKLDLEVRRRKVQDLKTELGHVMMDNSKADIPLHKLANMPQSVQLDYGQTQTNMHSSSVVLRVDLDPQVYLNLNKPTQGKYKAIVDFIPRSANFDEEEVELANGIFMKLKSGTKPKLIKYSTCSMDCG